ncbi:MAG TPA: hypothetical protein VII58_12865 [Acidobacteriaceae bacterium]
MATTTHIAVPARAASPLALWHLLSLDAPTVAALWTWFIARSCGMRLPLAAPLAMALAVWIVYASDRLLDASRANTTERRAELEARHRFHHRHRRAFAVSIAAALIALGALLPLLDPAALRLYLMEGALLVGWFVLLHATHSAHRLPKEIAVGIFFSAAVFIPTIARTSALRLVLAPAALLLGALCALNCLFIYAWEHDETAAHGPPSATSPHATTKFALDHIASFAITLALSGLALAIFGPGPGRPIASACALSAISLLALNSRPTEFSRIHLRAAADLALLTPLLLLPLMRRIPRW